MVIGKVDVRTTKILQKRMDRKALTEKRKEKYLCQARKATMLGVHTAKHISSSPSSSSSSSKMEEIEFIPTDSENTETFPSTSQMRVALPTVAQTCDRTGVSDRSAAILVNATLKDIGIITKDDSSRVVDRAKIRRERVKVRRDLKRKTIEKHPSIFGLYFDGRRDKTLKQTKVGKITARTTIKEEHIVLVSEPGSMYLGHVAPISGKVQSVAESILYFLNKNVDITTLQAIGCDGAVINTGHNNGIIRQIEIFLGHPLQWFICLLHTNELPLRYLLLHFEGKTFGPKGYCGPIGKQLERCEEMPIVKFEKITVSLPEISQHELSTDQQYMYLMCKGISKGIISSSLSARNPGNVSHSRWLTTANRILRLYISTKEPSQNLKLITEYVIKVYAPSWFEIKSKPSCQHGSNHFFGIIEKSRFLPEHIKNIIYSALQRNGYFAHPENILISMLADNKQHIRELGLRRILKSREMIKGRSQVREFKIPILNFEADTYIDLIDWLSVEITEPPLTKSISDHDLKSMISDVSAEIDILKFPCHTQAVERCIKLVTEASAAVCGIESRDGFIRSRIESRRTLPKFETKRQYETVLKDK